MHSDSISRWTNGTRIYSPVLTRDNITSYYYKNNYFNPYQLFSRGRNIQSIPYINEELNSNHFKHIDYKQLQPTPPPRVGGVNSYIQTVNHHRAISKIYI
jgi:hypothetical protein